MEQLDLEEGVVRFYAKGPRWRTIPLQDEVLDLSGKVPGEKRTGRVFPWSTRQNAYRWLRPLVRELGVTLKGRRCGRSWPHSGTMTRGARSGIKTSRLRLYAKLLLKYRDSGWYDERAHGA